MANKAMNEGKMRTAALIYKKLDFLGDIIGSVNAGYLFDNHNVLNRDDIEFDKLIDDLKSDKIFNVL